ncbi:MAG TPA: outer membrane lipoprotein chaperone LolA [Polyangia bacterium]|jgi:outer membrane lipoprotein carrier protein|nr:outer membrane lipoprotein chaperone LolA [Polyangia bacterium]
MGITSVVVAVAFSLMAEPQPRAARAPAPVVAASRLDLKTVVDRVQHRYDAAGDFRARFTQTLTNPTFNRKSTSSGEVLLKKPGRMRWNYEKPEPKMYLADGDLLWLYEPEDKQAFKQELKSSQLPAALAFLTGKGKLSDEFEISFAPNPGYGSARDYVLLLQPKRAQAQVKSLMFVVDPTSFHVRESILVDGQGNINDMLFSDVKVGTGLPDASFRWTPPAGVRVIDTAKLGK